MDTLQHKIDRFRELHQQPGLIINNFWDGLTLRAAVSLGAQALASTSAGVAWVLGFQDGHAVPRQRALDHLRGLIAITNLPVSLDMEDGLLGQNETMHDLARDLYEVGAVGLNIEDSHAGRSLPVDMAARRIAELRAAAKSLGYDLFINARVDSFLRGEATDAESLIERGHAYVQAGADCVFTPGVTDLAMCRQLAKEMGAPVNVLARPHGPSAAQLFDAGITRVSAGSFCAEAAYGAALEVMRQFQGHGALKALGEHHLSYAAVNQLARAQ